jgi:hypothetical protein
MELSIDTIEIVTGLAVLHTVKVLVQLRDLLWRDGIETLARKPHLQHLADLLGLDHQVNAITKEVDEDTIREEIGIETVDNHAHPRFGRDDTDDLQGLDSLAQYVAGHPEFLSHLLFGSQLVTWFEVVFDNVFSQLFVHFEI